MMETWWIVQGVGFLALLLNCGAFLCKTRQSIIAVQIVSALIWAIHFELLDARTAVLMNVLGATRQSVFFFRGRYRWADSRWWPAGFCLVFVVGGFLSWQSFSSLLPMAAMLFGTLAAWQVETWKLRRLKAFSPLFGGLVFLRYSIVLMFPLQHALRMREETLLGTGLPALGFTQILNSDGKLTPTHP